MRWNIENIKKECENLDITIISNFYTSKEKQIFLCKCGNKFIRKWSNVLLGQTTCLECSQNRLNLLNEQRRLESYGILNKYIIDNNLNFKVLTDLKNYQGNKQRLDVLCSCGKLFNPTGNNITRGNVKSCKSCSDVLKGKSRRISKQEIINNCKTIGYDILDYKYKNGHNLLVSCGKHDEYWTTYANFYHNGNRCKKCYNEIISYGEKSIADILDTYNIEYTKEKTFDNLLGVGGRNLRYDFYIKCNEFEFCIEYDGIQHFEKRFNMTDDDLKIIQHHDSLKDEYCIKNKIYLLRIKYDEDTSLKLKNFLDKTIPR